MTEQGQQGRQDEQGRQGEQGQQDDQGRQGQQGPDEPDPGAQLQPHQAMPPDQSPAIDAETYRQFQQFQQFQEFQRFQELQQSGEYRPVGQQPAHRRIRAPRWLRWLAKKLLTWLIFVVLTVLTLYWLFDYMFGSSSDDGRPVADTGGGKYHTNTILATKPYEAVRSVYDAIAQGSDAQYSCGRLDAQTQQVFADDLGGTACKPLVRKLHEQVTDANTYAEAVPSSPSRPITGSTVTISSCDFDISGGPALGTFTVTEVEHGQWLITGHEKGPKQCPETSGSTAPTR